MDMKKSQKKAIAVGAGVAALAAAAAGTYLFTGKRGEKNRATVKKWVGSAQKEVAKQVKGMEKMSKAAYNKTVDTVLQQYESLKDIDKSELLAVAKELKGHWDTISKEVSTASKKVKPVVQKVAKKAVKEVKSIAKPTPKKKPVTKGKKK